VGGIVSDPAVSYQEDVCLGGKKVYVLDTSMAELYSPLELIERVESCKEKICSIAREFVEHLPSSDKIGVSGRLSYDPSNARDIDIVVYGQRAGEEVYRALVDLRDDKVTEPFYGVGRCWSKSDVSLNKLVAEGRVVFGLFRGVEYNVRIVPCICPQKCIPRRIAGRRSIVGVIEDNKLSFMTPAYYVVKLHRQVVVGGLKTRRIFLVTYRLKYSELPLGLEVEVEGDIELFESTISIVPDHSGYVKPLIL